LRGRAGERVFEYLIFLTLSPTLSRQRERGIEIASLT